MPYVITFFITNILALIGEKICKQNKKIGILILILSVLPIILLGGMRVTSLGWDTDRYCVPIFNGIQGLSFADAITYLNTKQAETGFGILVYFLNLLEHVVANKSPSFSHTLLNVVLQYDTGKCEL